MGGGFGFTNTEQGADFGYAYLKPLGIQGEAAVAWAWSRPLESGLRNQQGLELYWKFLLLPRLWVTPGVQIVFNPTFNPGAHDRWGRQVPRRERLSRAE